MADIRIISGADIKKLFTLPMALEAVEQAFDLEKLELRDVTETIARDLYRTHYKLPEPGEDAGWDERYRS